MRKHKRPKKRLLPLHKFSTPVTPLSNMIDVFVEMERLQSSLIGFRDELVLHGEKRGYYPDLSAAKHSCRKILLELQSISSLLRLSIAAQIGELSRDDEPPSPPRGGKPKLVK